MLGLLPLAPLSSCARAPAVADPEPAAPEAASSGDLRPPEAFAAIADDPARARAIFLEASRVLLHPRCVNCHPDGDVPLQGDRGRLHDPIVYRGPADHGVVGMECASCHQDVNVPLARVPGAPEWHLAPRSMAWVGKSPRYVCEQLQDPERNGGKTLAQIVEHSAHDPLVGWGWEPGDGRTPAPGDQATFGALMRAWADAGAACPEEGAAG